MLYYNKVFYFEIKNYFYEKIQGSGGNLYIALSPFGNIRGKRFNSDFNETFRQENDN